MIKQWNCCSISPYQTLNSNHHLDKPFYQTPKEKKETIKHLVICTTLMHYSWNWWREKLLLNQNWRKQVHSLLGLQQTEEQRECAWSGGLKHVQGGCYQNDKNCTTKTQKRESRGKRKRNDVHKNESVCLMFPSICNILYTRIIMSFYTI